jgi:uncharacterized metal-binding protein YceD (DUF177 family)
VFQSGRFPETGPPAFSWASSEAGFGINPPVASSPRPADPIGMSLKVNLRLLEKESIQLDGDILASELAPDFQDELMRLSHPVEYELMVERQSDSLLVTGNLRTHVDCECARCLKVFLLSVQVDEFSLIVPLAGEEALPVDGDFADLTPAVREDILLSLPTNPLCGPDCRGLKPKGQPRELQVREQAEPNTAWSALDNLKL